MNVLVTGAAGFIGFHLTNRLLNDGHSVIGVDNLNEYYSVKLKEDRLAALVKRSNFRYRYLDFAERGPTEDLFAKEEFDVVVHLGAQAGVRYSLENPYAFGDSNLSGFLNILEGCRQRNIRHLIFASSSSVYGLTHDVPFSVDQNVDHPISLYAATKKANELMAHSYSHLYGLPVTGLRFFTVYGPWGRPDMAYFSFTSAILSGEPISVFNNGEMERDMTYIDDAVEGIVRLLEKAPEGPTSHSASVSDAPYRIYNVGAGRPVKLGRFIQAIETAVGREAVKNYLPMQPGDVRITYADVQDLENATGFTPQVTVEEGIDRFVQWYLKYSDKRVTI